MPLKPSSLFVSLAALALVIEVVACRKLDPAKSTTLVDAPLRASASDPDKNHLSASFGLKQPATEAPSGKFVYIQEQWPVNGKFPCMDFRTQEADDDHTTIQLHDCFQNIPQQFELVKLGNGMYRLRTNYTHDRYVGGWAVDPRDAVGAKIWAITIPPAAAASASAATLFQWNLVTADSANQIYFIVNVATGLCLDRNDFGDEMQQYICNASIRQRWKLIPAQ